MNTMWALARLAWVVGSGLNRPPSVLKEYAEAIMKGFRL